VAKLVYLMCAVTAAACTWLMLRAYLTTRTKLLLWSGLCFGGMTLNNVLLVFDRLVFVSQDLSPWRLGAALAAVLLLVTGLVMEAD
jgi:hypothetical protein